MPLSDTQQTTENLSFWLFLVKSSFTYRLTFVLAGGEKVQHLAHVIWINVLVAVGDILLFWKCFCNKDHVGPGRVIPAQEYKALCSKGAMHRRQEVRPNRSPEENVCYHDNLAMFCGSLLPQYVLSYNLHTLDICVLFPCKYCHSGCLCFNNQHIDCVFYLEFLLQRIDKVALCCVLLHACRMTCRGTGWVCMFHVFTVENWYMCTSLNWIPPHVSDVFPFIQAHMLTCTCAVGVCVCLLSLANLYWQFVFITGTLLLYW